MLQLYSGIMKLTKSQSLAPQNASHNSTVPCRSSIQIDSCQIDMPVLSTETILQVLNYYTRNCAAIHVMV